jgi:hypothetical protein
MRNPVSREISAQEDPISADEKESGGILMSISPVSNVSPLHLTKTVQSPPPEAASQPASDTVHLSPAAAVQAKGGEINHRGESH